MALLRLNFHMTVKVLAVGVFVVTTLTACYKMPPLENGKLDSRDVVSIEKALRNYEGEPDIRLPGLASKRFEMDPGARIVTIYDVIMESGEYSDRIDLSLSYDENEQTRSWEILGY